MGFGVAARRPWGKTDPCGHYLTEIRFNHFDAASGNPCDGRRNRPAHAWSEVPEPLPA